MINNHKFLLVLLCTLMLLSSLSLAYKQTPPNQIVHQYITNESQNVWPLLPYEIKAHLTQPLDEEIDGSYTPNEDDDIITASGEEDLDWYVAWTAWYRNHYWDPDVHQYGKYDWGLYGYQSNYQRAKNIWNTQVVPNYLKGNTDESYYWLGRVAHLLEDTAQPGHVLGDCHADIIWDWVPCLGRDSALEEFTASQNNYWGDTSGKMNVQHFDGSDYFGEQYNYENLIDGFNWNYIEPAKNDYFFRLFWYTAQKTQYFASDEEEHNFVYNKMVGGEQNWDCSGSGSNNLWADEGYTSCSDFINESQMQIDDPTNNGTYVSAEAEAVIPHAMRAVAGVYRLFDDAVRIDWPTENHDYRRTSFTLLKGDMPNANAVEKTAFVLSTNITQEQVLKPIVADIDGNGAMETVTFVHNINAPTKTDVYAVETKKVSGKTPKTTPKWKQTVTGGATMFPGTLADLDGASGSRKELITGVHNNSVGKVYAYNIGSDGKSISQRWVYTLNSKWSPLASMNVIRYDGGTAAVDVDKDGKNEIVLADVFEPDPDWPGEVYVLKDDSGSVSLLGNYTFGNGGAYATISAADVDGDGYPEIFVPSLYGVFAIHYNTSAPNKLSKIWSNSDGKIESSPVIADVDMDNEYEVVYTTSNYSCAAGKSCSNKVYVRNAKTGASEKEMSVSNLPRPTPSVANLDSDSNLEIVVIAKDATGSYGDVYCYDAVGGESPQWTFNLNNQLKTSYMSPSIADIDNNGKYNVVLAENNGNRVFVLKEDGTELFHYQFEGYVDNAIAIADVDQDNVAELALKRAGSPITLFSTMSSYNKPPELNQIADITAIVGDLINLNATGEVGAIDLNENDTVSFNYGAPFNNSGIWQTTVNDTGNYSLFIEATDGNLSDYRYLNVIVFNETTEVTNSFSDNSTKKTLNYTSAGNQTVQIRLPKNVTVIYSKITLQGLAS